MEGLEISICDVYDSTHNLRKKPFILLSAMGFVEFDGIKGCVQKAYYFSTTTWQVTSPTWGPPPPCNQALTWQIVTPADRVTWQTGQPA